MRTVRRFHIQENGVLYPSENGMVCYYMDVRRLEALNAKLLEDLKYIENAVKIGLPSGSILEIVKVSRNSARAAIAKAEGEQP